MNVFGVDDEDYYRRTIERYYRLHDWPGGRIYIQPASAAVFLTRPDRLAQDFLSRDATWDHIISGLKDPSRVVAVSAVLQLLHVASPRDTPPEVRRELRRLVARDASPTLQALAKRGLSRSNADSMAAAEQTPE